MISQNNYPIKTQSCTVVSNNSLFKVFFLLGSGRHFKTNWLSLIIIGSSSSSGSSSNLFHVGDK